MTTIDSTFAKQFKPNADDIEALIGAAQYVINELAGSRSRKATTREWLNGQAEAFIQALAILGAPAQLRQQLREEHAEARIAAGL